MEKSNPMHGYEGRKPKGKPFATTVIGKKFRFSPVKAKKIQKEDDSFISQFSDFLLKEVGVELEKQVPPGLPPRPGLRWRQSSRRWVRPVEAKAVKPKAGKKVSYTLKDWRKIYGKPRAR